MGVISKLYKPSWKRRPGLQKYALNRNNPNCAIQHFNDICKSTEFKKTKPRPLLNCPNMHYPSTLIGINKTQSLKKRQVQFQSQIISSGPYQSDAKLKARLTLASYYSPRHELIRSTVSRSEVIKQNMGSNQSEIDPAQQLAILLKALAPILSGRNQIRGPVFREMPRSSVEDQSMLSTMKRKPIYRKSRPLVPLKING